MGTPRHLDEQALQELKGIMGSDFPLLVQTFLTDSRQRIAAVSAALDTDDSDALRRAAHSFKGSSSNLGALELAAICQQLEDHGRDGETGADCPALLSQLAQEFHYVEHELTLLSQ